MRQRLVWRLRMLPLQSVGVPTMSATEERITFRCLYPDNCNCCPPNVEAFRAVKADAERMQREHTEDLDRMERAAEALEKHIAENARLKAELADMTSKAFAALALVPDGVTVGELQTLREKALSALKENTK
jgi:hypothetical protein